MTADVVEIKRCRNPDACQAELDYGTGVTECNAKNCNLIGWLRTDGEIYNVPQPKKRDDE